MQGQSVRTIGPDPAPGGEPEVILVGGPRGSAESGAPFTADLRLTGSCQLRCQWCWGPAHSIPGKVTPAQWEEIIQRLATAGTRQVVLSGGEPTLSRSFRTALVEAKAAGLSVTLSTSGIGLKKHADIISLLDDIGIPIDGSTPERNDGMRDRSSRHRAWEEAVNAIRLVQEMRESGSEVPAVTVRTVVAQPNLTDLGQIPGALETAGIDLGAVRFKLYQVEPFGPQVPHIDFAQWAVTEREATEAAYELAAAVPARRVWLQLYRRTVGRYFLVDPEGVATGTDEDAGGIPIEIPYGNVIDDFEAALAAYAAHQRTVASVT
jgi:MoaA/NifB/PqqE/SkfB family radical SAM enzyme